MLTAKAIQHPGCRILIVRNHRSDITKSIIPTLEDEVFPRFGWTTPPGGCLDRKSRTEYLIGKPGKYQSRIALGGLDTDGAASLLSTAWTYCYVAEATEIDFDIVMKIPGCMRWTKSGENPQLPDIAQIYMDGNPTSPSHPINKKAEECTDELRMVRSREDYWRLHEYNMRPCADPKNKIKRIVSKVQDNPGYWDWDKWDYTPQGRQYYESQLGTLEGFMRDRWVYGLWAAAEGSVYSNFRRSVHVCEPFDVPKDWPIYCFWDPGYDHPTGIAWVAIAPDNTYYVIDEIYQSGQTAQQHAATLRSKNKAKGRVISGFYGDPYGAFRRVAESAMSIQEQLAEVGIDLEEWPRAMGPDVIAGVNLVRERLIRTQNDDEAGLKVFRTCENTIAEFENWKYKRMADGRQPVGDDAFVDSNNDLLDGIRGATVLDLKYDGSSNVQVYGPRVPRKD